MEGNKKTIEQEKSAAPGSPIGSIPGSPFTFIKTPTNHPPPPSSLHSRKKPYFMNHNGVGASSSAGPKTCSFQGSDPLPMIPENVNQIDQGLILNTSAVDNSTKTAHGGPILEHNMDPKVLKRVMSNRLSAQKSRNKKLQYVSDLEAKMKAMQTLVAELAPKVEAEVNKKTLLLMEQNHLKQKIGACISKSITQEAEIEARTKELFRLQNLLRKQQQQQQQQQQPLQGQQTTMDGVWEHDLSEGMMNHGLNLGTEQAMYLVPNQDEIEAKAQELEEIKLQNLHLMQQQQQQPLQGQQTAMDGVCEHDLSEGMMNHGLNPGTEEAMYFAPTQANAGERGGNSELHFDTGM